jgi:hypothetical protein
VLLLGLLAFLTAAVAHAHALLIRVCKQQ